MLYFAAYWNVGIEMAGSAVAFGVHKEKTYGWVENRNGWVVTWLDDAGLSNAMKLEAAREIRILKRDGLTYQYWVVDKERFGNLRNLLDALGYISYTKAADAAQHIQNPPKPAESVQKSLQSTPIPNSIPSSDTKGVAFSRQPTPAPGSRTLQSPQPADGSFRVVTETAFRADLSAFSLEQPQRTSPSKGAKIYTVSQMNTAIKETFRKHLSTEVWVEGDIVDFRFGGKGYYFQLAEKNKDADENASKSGKKDSFTLDCVIWQSAWQRITSELSPDDIKKICNNTKTRMRGHIDSYLMNNKPSFIVSEVDVYFEEGDFYKEKLIIENRLKEQGILDNNKKLPMPFLPLRLAVFSNESSAGWGDFIKKIYESMFPFEITIFQTALQGKELEPAMMKAFEMLEKYGTDKFDVGVILRGGGATKDLYDFNNYRIAEYITRCPLKFLIGIGHGRDTTVLDDITSEDLITPTDVGVYLVGIISDIFNRLENAHRDLHIYSKQNLDRLQNKLSILSEQSKNLAQNGVHRAERQLDGFRTTIDRIARDNLKEKSYLIEKYRSDLENFSVIGRNHIQNQLATLRQTLNYGFEQNCERFRMQFESYRQTIGTLCNGLLRNAQMKLENSRNRLNDSACEGIRNAGNQLEQYRKMVELLRPDEMIKRGFVTVSDSSGHRITDISQIKEKDSLSIGFANGKAEVTVDRITPKTP